MRFLKHLVKPPRGAALRTRHFRSLSGTSPLNDEDRTHSKDRGEGHSRKGSRGGRYQSSHASPYTDLHASSASKAPAEVLMTIFSFVCPHALDETYLSAEESAIELGCMLCDMRELSHCALVCRSWHGAAQLLQYRSIRLDSVHYCGLEEELQVRRKRGSLFQKQTSLLEVPERRMRLLYRTFQENEATATLTEFLKIPYMTRETCKQDLAPLVSLLPNLRYVDLPEGVYQDDPSCASLKAILYTRCPDLRKMSWAGGSEKGFVHLWIEPPWLCLQVVELTDMRVENQDLVRVLSSMPYLTNLKIKSMPWTTDAIFDSTATDAGPLPALQTLTIEDTPSITIAGLTAYLARPVASETLETLTITNTPIPVHSLHQILPLATRLTSLSIRAQVSRTISRQDVPLLASASLTHLAYDITDDDTSAKSLAKPSPSYYAYLSESLWDGGMPELKTLYVREPAFPARLQNDKASARASAATGWKRGLYLHTKGMEHLEWTKYSVRGVGRGLLVLPTPGGGGACSRASFFADPGDGNGGGKGRASFPGMPGDAEEHTPGKRERRKSRVDLWR
ncbi:unnamed protein product [Tuber aestivum]|uniref:Uncharacterized protein n=1 Tax=Tuber aestivum TaxID=59557 RepID=A0A292PPQ5_9PEZI|nr:unnamed protein product [Tuber aestivum]